MSEFRTTTARQGPRLCRGNAVGRVFDCERASRLDAEPARGEIGVGRGLPGRASPAHIDVVELTKAEALEVTEHPVIRGARSDRDTEAGGVRLADPRHHPGQHLLGREQRVTVGPAGRVHLVDVDRARRPRDQQVEQVAVVGIGPDRRRPHSSSVGGVPP